MSRINGLKEWRDRLRFENTFVPNRLAVGVEVSRPLVPGFDYRLEVNIGNWNFTAKWMMQDERGYPKVISYRGD